MTDHEAGIEAAADALATRLVDPSFGPTHFQLKMRERDRARVAVDAYLSFLRAAHPEAGSEEGERVKRIALDNLRGYQEATAGLDRALDDMRRERDEARAELAALRAAHPEARFGAGRAEDET